MRAAREGAAVVVVLLVAAGVAVAVASGRGGHQRRGAAEEGPGAFMTHVVQLIGANRYGEAWLLMHPAQRRLAGLEEYVTCEIRSPIPGRVRSVRVEDVRAEPAQVAPGRFVSSTGVAVRIEIAGGLLSRPVVVHDTVHAVRLGSRWTWLLPPERLAQYGANRCPVAAAAQGPPAA